MTYQETFADRQIVALTRTRGCETVELERSHSLLEETCMKFSRSVAFLWALAGGLLVVPAATAQGPEPNTLWFTPNVNVTFGDSITGGTFGGTVTYERVFMDRVGFTVSAGGDLSQHTSESQTTRTAALTFGAGLAVRPIRGLDWFAVRPSLSAALDPKTANVTPGAALDLAWTPVWSSLAPGRFMITMGMGVGFADTLFVYPTWGLSFGIRF